MFLGIFMHFQDLGAKGIPYIPCNTPIPPHKHSDFPSLCAPFPISHQDIKSMPENGQVWSLTRKNFKRGTPFETFSRTMVINIANMCSHITNKLVIRTSMKFNLGYSHFGLLDPMLNIVLILFIRFQARLHDLIFTTELDPFGTKILSLVAIGNNYHQDTKACNELL